MGVSLYSIYIFNVGFLPGPANYDFKDTREITIYDTVLLEGDASSTSGSNRPTPTNPDNESISDETKKDVEKVQVQEVSDQTISSDNKEKQEVDLETLQRIFKRATVYSIILTLIVAILGSYSVASKIFLVPD